MRYLPTLIISLLLAVASPAGGRGIKNIGIPAIRNFPRGLYRASTQNWSVVQDHRDFLYFANNDGLLEYDGTYWVLHQFVEPALTRSLATDGKGTLYAGMVNEFGMVRPDARGKLQFTSFRQGLQGFPNDLGDIWRVFATPEGIFFQSFSYLFQFSPQGELIRHFSSPGNFRFSFLVHGRLYLQEMGKGLLLLEGDQLVKLPGLESLVDKEIWALLPGYGNQLIIGTSAHGVFTFSGSGLTPWTTPANELLRSHQIFSACPVGENSLAFGTIRGGVVITTATGELIQHLDKNNGLQNNTVLSITTDRKGNLWMGLDNGIDFAEISSPLTFLHHPGGFGTGYAAAIHNGYLYLGTNNGLFASPWSPANTGSQPSFRLVPHTVGQVWHLSVHADQLLCGHDNGTYLVRGMEATRISTERGAWTFIELSRHPGKLIGGTYEGLTLYQYLPALKRWEFVKLLPGFRESSRVMEEDREGNLWMTHGFKGAFKIKLSDQADSVIQTEYYNTEKGFVTNNYINVYKIDNQPVFSAREGIFTYNGATNLFARDTLLEKRFGTHEHISYIRQDEKRNIWFVAGNKPALLRWGEDGRHTLVKAPFELIHNHMVGGFEMIYPWNNDHIFFGLENGFAHYTPEPEAFGELPFRVFIRRVEIGGELFYSGNGETQNADALLPTFPYRENAVRVTFSAPRYDGKKEVEYSYRLSRGSGNGWSPWSQSTTCEFTNLREGEYLFTVRARDALGTLSPSDTFRFRISPPWYRSHLALSGYLLLGLMLLTLLTWFILRRMEISRRRERLRQLRNYRSKEQQYQREALIAEKEIMNLRNEKLRESMIHRDKELANQTLHLIRKNKFLVKIKEELRKMEIQSRDESLKTRLAMQIRRIDKEIDDEKQWEVFETAFDEVHEDFLVRLKERFPDLTPREMRLCAYLKMNISTKEISTLMNISVRGVEISRYRLRKKLGIGRETNLTLFILGL